MDISISMAKGLQRKRQRQQQTAELQQLRAIVDNAAIRHAFTQPPVPRPGHQWDWECGTCGHVNYAGRTLCHKHMCIGPRSKGHTMVGFKRGVLQDSAAAQTARQQQLQTLSLPSAYQVAAGRPRPESKSAHVPPNVDRPQQPSQHGQQLQQKQKEQQLQQQAPTRRVQQPARATTALRQTTTVAADSGGHARSPPTLETGNSASKQGHTEQPRSFQQLAEEENAVRDPGTAEDEDIEEATDFEDLDADPLHLRRRHVKLAKALEWRERRLAKERARIEEQHDEIAAQQARLVELQSVADSTAQEIVSLQGKVSSICQQITRIEAERGKGTAAAASGEGGPTPEQHARDCLERTVAAFQHFQGQSPQVQCLLQQFVTIFDKMRAAEPIVDAKQATLEQVFARTANPTPPAPVQNLVASSPPVEMRAAEPVDTKQGTLEQTFARAAISAPSSGVAQLPATVDPGGAAAQGASKPQTFDIGSEASITEIASESMRVDGHNVGDKRKQEHLHDAERISQKEAAARDEQENLPAVAAINSAENPSPVAGNPTIEVDAQGVNATPATLEPPQKTFAKREHMLSDLEDRNAKDRNAKQAVARQRFSPYGQG